ncbi:hypothetical protein [Bacillus sp. AFS040349]|uniref:hypothetical protein n=1 Tax=Bacillus sp. AFS040349 TaxID=2033502 RepID=UPI000BFCB7E8|nr:hypothetical protein [Bacillus sp. AFS040349]PGT80572.1 hypothetical protein COD11_20900 [Bacillus sp. AFS040349]
MSMEYNKESLLKVLEKHANHLTTARGWTDYVKEQDQILPSSGTLINHFGSWNDVKEALNIKGGFYKERVYDKETLLTIAGEHAEYFTTKSKWNKYAKEEGLPSTSTYIKMFESWNKVKEELELKPTDEQAGSQGYTKEEIEQVLQVHGKNIVTRKQWDEYAHEHELPTYKTLKKHFTWEEILSYSNVKKKKTRQELLDIAKKHYEVFASASMNIWNEYAIKHSLPSAHFYFKEFGSWKKAKVAVIKARDNYAN